MPLKIPSCLTSVLALGTGMLPYVHVHSIYMAPETTLQSSLKVTLRTLEILDLAVYYSHVIVKVDL